MGLITGNGIEGETAIEGLLGSKRFEHIGGRDFSHRRILFPLFTFLFPFINPFQKFHHRDAVFQHRRLKTRDFPFILYGLHPLDGRLSLNNFTSH